MVSMDDLDPKKLQQRFDETRNWKYRWLAQFIQLYWWFIPDRDAFNVLFGYRDDGKPTTLQMWDNWGYICAGRWANEMQGLLIPQGRDWGSYAMDPHLYTPEEMQKFAPMLEEANKRTMFYLNGSNLSRAASSAFSDLVGGMGALFVTSPSDMDPLNFVAIPAVSTFGEYSTDDIITTAWYINKMTSRQILAVYPKYKGAKLSYLHNNLNEVMQVVFGQIKLRNGNYYMYTALEQDQTSILWDTEKPYQQLIIFRDKVRPGEVDGRGLGMDLIPLAQTLNQLVEYSIKFQEFKAYPPAFVTANRWFNPYVFNQWAGAIIQKPAGMEDPLKFLQTPESQSTLLEIQDLRQQMKEAFQVDPLGEVTNPKASATEVSIRQNRAQRFAVTNQSRISNECSGQIFKVSTEILMERNLLDKGRTPDRLGLRDHKFHFKFQSPLLDLQKQENINKFTQACQILQQFYGAEAPSLATNVLEVNKFIWNEFDLPIKLAKSDEEFIANAQAIQQQGQQQQGEPTPTTSAIQTQLPQGGVQF